MGRGALGQRGEERGPQISGGEINRQRSRHLPG